MGLAQVGAFLRRHRRIALDTSLFIYYMEDNSRYVDLAIPIFEWLEQAGNSVVTSTITMTELMVLPYRREDESRVNEFYSLLLEYPHLEWVPASLAVADRAARIRATHRLKTVDALQAATAAQSGATGLVTNDVAFERLDDFETLVLDRVFE